MTSHIPATVTGDQRRREQRGWFFYDWAASAFSTTVVTVFMGPDLTTVTEDAAGPDGYVTVLGIQVRDSAWFPAMITTSVLIQVFLLPVVGAVADRARSKRLLLGLFAGIGSVATMLMFFVRDGHFALGGLLLVVANIAFGASIVVYNAFLPEVATPDERDAVSARGWALGYLGGFILLLLNLVLFSAHDSFGLTEGEAVRLCLLSAGVWWALFATIPLRRLVDRPPVHLQGEPGDAPGVVVGAFRQLAAHPEGPAELPADVVVPAGLPVLQRRHPDGDRVLGDVRRRSRPRGRDPHPGDPAGPARGVPRRAPARSDRHAAAGPRTRSSARWSSGPSSSSTPS